MAQGDAAARGVAALMFIAAAGLYFAWPRITRWTADATEGDAALWLYATDVTPGDRIDGRVRVDTGLRVAIRGIRVVGAGAEQILDGGGRGWGDKITAHDYDEAKAEAAFTFEIPRDAPPGDSLDVTIELDYVAAELSGIHTFSNDDQQVEFHQTIPIHTHLASVLRRVGKALLAVLSWLAVVAGVTWATRWYARRRREPSTAWILALIPYTVAGWVWFATLLEHATRLHGWWFVAICLPFWFAALWAAARLTRFAGMTRYVAEQLMIAHDGAADAPFRGGAVAARIISLDQLETAWFGAGLVVERERGRLVLSLPGRGIAVVPMPETGTFGGGPLEVQARSRDVALAVLEAAAPLLGELRVVVDGEQFRVTGKPIPGLG